MKTFDYGFVIPLEVEAMPLLRNCTLQKIHKIALRKIYTGVLFNKRVSVIISGCGKIKTASATQFLADAFPAKRYIHYGTAGALSDKLKIGDIIAATHVIEHDFVELFPKKIPPPIYKITHYFDAKKIKSENFSLIRGAILSGDEDIISTKRKQELNRLYKGLSVDWESAGFTLTCKLNAVKGYVFRGISDYAHEHTTTEYGKNQKLVMHNILHLLKNLFLYDSDRK